ncbi:MAG: lipid A biosynthesis lauroyl acyltransferase [Gammaproteobacteria bacterium]|nr:MAG: lipid A biosynthesis lauroyl acyltransferase [Gammaproteobacteria bacterium]
MLRLTVLLPYRWQMRLGRLLGRLLMPLLKYRRHIADTNLRLCFPELNDTQRRQLLKRNFESLGMSLIETAISWWITEKRLEPLLQIEGLENLQQALQQGNGVLLLAPHLGAPDLMGRLLRMHHPLYAMYRKQKNPLFDIIMKRRREFLYDVTVDRKDTRGMLKALKKNMPVWYAADQDYGRKHSVFVPFFGIPTATIAATSRFAESSGARVVPFYLHRLADDAGYRLEVHPALENYPSGDLEQDAARINALFEEQIRRSPEQYLWIHRRFKTRPEGMQKVY